MLHTWKAFAGWRNLAREKEHWKNKDIFKYPFQLTYLEVLGSIFTCTIMFRSTSGIPFPANTPKWSVSVLAQWTGVVTVVFSCLTLVYLWKLRIYAELPNCRSVKHHNMPYMSYFDDAFIISTWFTPLKFDKRRRHF